MFFFNKLVSGPASLSTLELVSKLTALNSQNCMYVPPIYVANILPNPWMSRPETWAMLKLQEERGGGVLCEPQNLINWSVVGVSLSLMHNLVKTTLNTNSFC